MRTHNLIQGSPEWLAHRAQYKNASDSPVVMGESKYKTRSQLLAERHSGITPDVDAGTQRLFDDGHRFEALARPLAEKIIGEALSPTTGTEGEFGASFDGITFDDCVIWEHKSINDELRQIKHADDLPLMYRIQMEHQLMVSGATRCLFSATKWDGDSLLEEMHCFYVCDIPLRARIVAAWKQFDADLASYVPPEVIEAPQADAIKDLPAVTIQVTGELTKCNLDAVTPQFDRYLEEAGTKLATIDIANGKAVGKFSRETAKALKSKAQDVVDQIATVSEAVKTLKFYAEQFDAMGLKYEKETDKLEKAETEAAIGKVTAEYIKHVDALELETAPVRLSVAKPNFAGALKSLRTIESKNNALNQALANGKIAADAEAKDLRAKLAWYREGYMAYPQLFADFSQIIYKPIDDFKLIVTTRIDQHTAAEAAKLEAERRRIRAEEEARAEAKVQAEALQEAKRLDSIRREEERQKTLEAEALRRIEADERAKVEAEQIKPCQPLDITAPAMSAPVPAMKATPTRVQMIEAVALAFGASESTAADWLINEFQQRAA